jgi:hypothetical protein
MRIDINVTATGFDEQTRAYAEFRTFSALARFARDIVSATVALSRSDGFPQSVVCSVSITFSGEGRLRVRAQGGHAYDAINRAAARAADLLRDEHPVAVPSYLPWCASRASW